jgi:uncharacterized cupin superfamily protein
MDALIKVPAAAFGDTLFAFEGQLPPGARIPSHTHAHEDEVTIVLSGDLTVELDGKVSAAPAGSVVLKPRGVAHSLSNTSSEPVTVMEIHTPGRLEPYYLLLGELFASLDGDDQSRLAAIRALHAKYGITYHEAPVARPQ